jgi:hypothetical protein
MAFSSLSVCFPGFFREAIGKGWVEAILALKAKLRQLRLPQFAQVAI